MGPLLEKVRPAAKAAHASEFVENLPDTATPPCSETTA